MKKKNYIEGPASEYDCTIALIGMKNNRSLGSNEFTTEFYKIFWNDVKSYHVKSLNYSFENGNMTAMRKTRINFVTSKKE